MDFNWHNNIWENLTQSYRSGRLAHGLVFHGHKGIGKYQFTRDFAAWLICEQNQAASVACGECRTCQLFKAGTYPDIHEITPEEEGKAIKVDQVRELIEKISLTGHGAGMRVVIISPADAMNVNAANSLLKTLEEPPENTVLILVTDQPSRLVPTIRSRCQMVRFDTPSKEQSLSWLSSKPVEKPDLLLNLAGGAPFTALSLADEDAMDMRNQHFQYWQELAGAQVDALEIAGKWLKDSLKISPELPLNWIHSWILDMIRIIQGAQGESKEFLVNSDVANHLQNLAGQVDLSSLYQLLDRVNDTYRLLSGSANQQALIEGILIHWSGMKRITT